MNNRVRTVIARKVKTIVEPLHYLAYVVFGDRVLHPITVPAGKGSETVYLAVASAETSFSDYPPSRAERGSPRISN